MKAENLICSAVETEDVLVSGVPAVRVVKTQLLDEFDTNSAAFLPEVVFQNGTIDVDVMGKLLPDAPDFARGFIGIVFRAAPDFSEFEGFYLRPTNGIFVCDDPIRQNRGCQYFSFPGYTFSYFRRFGITKYEAPCDTAPGKWSHIRAAVQDDSAEFFVDDMEHPVLSVTDLKHGKSSGCVGLFVDTGTEGYFRNLSVRSIN